MAFTSVETSGIKTGSIINISLISEDISKSINELESKSGEKVKDVIITNLLDKDRDNYRQHFKGIDTVVHCGFTGSASQTHRQFWTELDNVAMSYNIYQTCI